MFFLAAVNSLPVHALEKAVDFTVIDVFGTQVSLSDFREDVVLLEFMDPYECPACDAELPHLKDVYQHYSGENVTLISISLGQEDDMVLRSWVLNEGIGWIVAKGNSLISAYNIQFIPTLILIDQEGYIVYRHEMLTDFSTLESEIDSILQGGGGGMPFQYVGIVVVAVFFLFLGGLIAVGKREQWSKPKKKRAP